MAGTRARDPDLIKEPHPRLVREGDWNEQAHTTLQYAIANMQCFSELVPPTAVTHALSLHFLGPNDTNLIVVKTSLLQVFSIANSSREGSGTAALKLVGEYSFSGTVTSLAKIRAADTKTGGEALLVSFKDAKVSLLEWDPENYRISTVSIHFYEGGKVQLAPFEPPLSETKSKLVVDPRSRCAALRFASRHLAILPFRQPDDDLAAVDDDFLEAGNQTKPANNGTALPNGNDRAQTPYGASFVLPLTALDPSLTHPVDLAFLYEYREPTFGIVSANRNATTALLDERKDPLTYTVVTLDLEQRASTTLISVKGLPYDIWKVVPLPQPIGGSLLVGTNELVHVDQSGKTNAVGVNEFARQCSDFSLADQSDLGLRLENCCIETLNADTGDLLIVLPSGDLAILSFKIDGRTVSGIHVHPVEESHGGQIPSPIPSATANLPANRIFVGSQVGNATLVSWSGQTAQTNRKRSHAQMLGEDMGIEIDEADLEDDEDDDADDDLYGDQDLTKSTMHRVSKTVAPENYVFQQIGSLPSLAQIKSIAIGRPSSNNSSSGSDDKTLELLISHGESKSSRLSKVTRELTLNVVSEEADSKVHAVFPFQVHSDEQGVKACAITSEISDDGQQSSKLFDTSSGDKDQVLPWTEITGTDFEQDGPTSNVFVLQQNKRVIHVRDSEVRCYDSDFGLSQIFPIVDSDTETELQVVQSSFSEPYLLLLRSDSSIQLLKADATGELDEVEGGELQKETRWLSGCLYRSADLLLCSLMNERGGLVLVDPEQFGQAAWSGPDLAALPAVLTTQDRQRRAAARATLVEMLFADIGPSSDPSPYLIVRSSTDEIVMYEPFHNPHTHTSRGKTFYEGLGFRKVSALHIPRFTDETSMQSPTTFKILPNVNGKAMVFVPGDSPSLIVKSATTMPQIFEIRGNPISFLTQIDSQDQSAVFAYVDASQTLRRAQLLSSLSFDHPRCIVENLQPLADTHEYHDISYAPDRNLYVIVSSTTTEFIPDDEDLQQLESDSKLSLRPRTKDYFVHLLTPINNAIISTQAIQPYEHVTGITCAPLEISETTHALESMISVVTMCQRADPYADKGSIYVYSIIDVVPEPDHPETGYSLNLVSQEETRAGLTAVTGIAGLSATAQGQKLMFRGLREDGQNLPVAFLDSLTYTTSLKTLGTSNMWIAADYWKGLWVGGYTQEPPRISVFAKSTPMMSLVDAEFLPHDGTLCLAAADADAGLQIWQFDPEHPKSLGGTRLIHRSSFQLGHLVTGMKLLPSSVAAMDQSGANGDEVPAPLYQVLTYATSGQLGLLTPLDEPQYRRLSALQSQLTNVLEHPAGLNPRAYRNVKSEEGGGRGVVDGDLLRRIGELGAGRRSEIIGRVVGEGGWWEIRSDLEVLMGRGLSYL